MGAAQPKEIPVKAIMIEILGVYGSEDLPVGARRRFVVVENDGGVTKIEGENLRTSQIRGTRARKKLVAELGRDR